MDRLVNLGMGIVTADEAFLLEVVEQATPKDLVEYFSDIEKFYELYGRFEQQVQKIQEGARMPISKTAITA